MFFPAISDRIVLKRKFQKIVLSDDDEEYEGGTTEPCLIAGGVSSLPTVSPPPPPTPTPHNSYDLNLAPLDETREIIPLYKIYIGKGVAVEIQPFKGSYYASLYRKDMNGACKNRFNIPISQLPQLKLAIEALETHIKKYST